MAAAHGGDHRGQAPVAAGEQRLDHAPAVALRAQVDALGLEPLRQELEPFLGFRADALPLEGGVGLGHKGADPEGQPQAWGGFFELEQEVGGGLDVVFVFRGQASHAVELQAAEATLFGVAGGGIDLVCGQLLVDHLAHALAAAFDGDR